jgi:hypothetical protein
VARKTIDPQHEELKAVLDGLLERNEDASARAVARLHSSIKDASGFIRHPERRQILEQYQARQKELRTAMGRVRQSGVTAAAVKLQASSERVRELESSEAARVASHVAMIHVVAEMGGTAKLLQIYKRFAPIRDSLARAGALPAQFIDEAEKS